MKFFLMQIPDEYTFMEFLNEKHRHRDIMNVGKEEGETTINR